MTSRFFDDSPADGSPQAPDLLGRMRYAEHAVQLLGRVRGQSDSSVLAMIGPWGAGKSTVLNMITQRLRGPAPDDNAARWSVAELNPWMYTDVESLAAALFGELRTALPTDDRWNDLRQKVGDFGMAISPVGKLGALAGLDASDLSKWAFERIRGDVSASATKERVSTALQDIDLSILVVMDDLDRLTPEELLLVFKLIRLVGNLPNVYYLISFDEQTLIDVLCRSDLVGSDPQRAREFLEKIVQVRLDLPAFRERDSLALTSKSLDLLTTSHQVEMSEDEQSRFSRAYFQHLQARLATPRAIKRFFAQADATLGPLVGEVDLCDFLLVTFLRTSESGVYHLLARFRGALTGTSLDFERARGMRPEQLEQRWHPRLQNAGVAEENRAGVLRLLHMLFPVEFSNGDSREAARRRGVGSADHFDRYFVFGIPEDDLSEREFERALEQLGAGTPGAELEALVARIRQDTHRTARRIRHRLDTGQWLPIPQLLQALSDSFGQLRSDTELGGLLTPERSAEVIAGDLLADLQAEEVATVLEAMASTPVGARLACAAFHHIAKERSTETATGVVPVRQYHDASQRLGARISDHLAPAADRPAEDLQVEEVRLIWGWWHTNPDTVRDWVGQRIDDGAWDILPLLTRLQPQRSSPFREVEAETADALAFIIGSRNLNAELDRHRGSLEDLEPYEAHLVRSLRHHQSKNLS
jgi:hypothetical protein